MYFAMVGIGLVMGSAHAKPAPGAQRANVSAPARGNFAAPLQALRGGADGAVGRRARPWRRGAAEPAGAARAARPLLSVAVEKKTMNNGKLGDDVEGRHEEGGS